MRSIKCNSKRVDEPCNLDSFFLCSDQSARHFDVYQECKLGAALEGARHLTATDANVVRQTIYTGLFDTSMSKSYNSGNVRVTRHA